LRDVNQVVSPEIHCFAMGGAVDCGAGVERRRARRGRDGRFGGRGVLYDLGPKIALDLAGGLAIFPSAKDRLDRDFAYPTDRSPGLTPAIQAGANIGLVFYP
jgi:hypothetical protein